VSIGPIFELPIAAISQLREVSATKGILLESLDDDGKGAFPGLYMFRGRLGRIHGRWRTSGGACQDRSGQIEFKLTHYPCSTVQSPSSV
jgi:hypothetical protein